MWPEIKRKFFHLTALSYVIGLIYLPRPVYIGVLAVLLSLVGMVEFVRLKNDKISRLFLSLFGGLIRAEEQARMTGVFWMLLGVLTTVLLLKPVPLASASILYLVLGDGVASLAGMRFGGPHWPGSRKRFAGSLACLLVCLMVGAVLLRHDYGWHGIVIGALVAAGVEASTLPLNDNFTIPVASAVAFLISYGIRPFV